MFTHIESLYTENWLYLYTDQSSMFLVYRELAQDIRGTIFTAQKD